MREGFPHTRHWADDGSDTGQCSMHRPSETGLEGTGPRVWFQGSWEARRECRFCSRVVSTVRRGVDGGRWSGNTLERPRGRDALRGNPEPGAVEGTVRRSFLEQRYSAAPRRVGGGGVAVAGPSPRGMWSHRATERFARPYLNRRHSQASDEPPGADLGVSPPIRPQTCPPVSLSRDKDGWGQREGPQARCAHRVLSCPGPAQTDDSPGT